MKMERETIILGAGESGVGAALLAQRLGRRVFVSDAGQPADRFLQELLEAGIEYEAGGHDQVRILEAALVIKSPGIPDKVALIQALRAKGVEVISEIEYAFRALSGNCKVVAITGSNGKTTTTSLTYHLLQKGGLDVAVGGNIGSSFARMLATEQPLPACVVLELSSFQLDGVTSFRADIGALLNITPDHLDRYDYRLDLYAASKFRIGAFQQAGDKFLYYQEDPITMQYMPSHPVGGQPIGISQGQIAANKQLLTSQGQAFSLATGKLRGQHNALNALFAIRIAQELGLSAAAIQLGLDSFQPVPHRMEEVLEWKGVCYINDSKATNVDAVFYALDAVQTPMVWIAGGTDKGNDYTPLLAVAAEKVHTLVCLGLDNEKLKATFTSIIPCVVEAASMAEALFKAHYFAQAGDTVLLSPACASFDLFKNYIDRGEQFREGITALAAGSNTHPKNKEL